MARPRREPEARALQARRWMRRQGGCGSVVAVSGSGACKRVRAGFRDLAWAAFVLSAAWGCAPAGSVSTPAPAEVASAPGTPAAGVDAPPKPIDNGMLATSDVTPTGAIVCSGAIDRGKLGTASPAVVAHFVVSIGPGDECVIPAMAGVEGLLVAVAGQGAVTLVDESRSRDLERWGALRVPGLGLRLQTRASGMTLVLAVATTDGSQLSSRLASASPWKAREGAVAEASFETVDELAWNQRRFRARIAFGAPDSPVLGLAVLNIAAGEAIAPHEHEVWEVVTILSGNAVMRVAEIEEAIGPWRTIAIPARTQHAVRAGGEDVVVVQSYSPAGPEQRFRRLAAEAAGVVE